MKKITIVLLGWFAIVSLQAQNYYIDFTASGAAITLDSVYVENLTQNTALTLQGSDTLHLTGSVGISSHLKNSETIKIYPNPFTETSHLEFYSETPAVATVDVYDAVGRHILQLRQGIQKGVNLFEISGFSAGHYHLIVKTAKRQESASFFTLNPESSSPKIQLKSTFLSDDIHLKSTKKSAKNIIQMPYTTGDEMQFTGYYGSLSDVVTDVPTSSKTINFVFTSFTCGDNVTFIYNGDTVTYGTVMSSGNCWLDRNLGALQVATSSTDTAAYGDLFQWGRGDDGHQVRTSGTTTTLSNSDTPGHSNFIIVTDNPNDWRSSINDSLWQGVYGINNPCPPGWRIPTEDEWIDERHSWSTDNAAGAFASPLKLTTAGGRQPDDGSVVAVGVLGHYWSNKFIGIHVNRLMFNGNVGSFSFYRAVGFSVRCIKDN